MNNGWYYFVQYSYYLKNIVFIVISHVGKCNCDRGDLQSVKWEVTCIYSYNKQRGPDWAQISEISINIVICLWTVYNSNL